MIWTDVYQTLEDRYGENTELEENGPYPAERKTAWLGEGYYFWEEFIENAHWWAKDGAKYGDEYIICHAECVLTHENCYDLFGNTKHIKEFRDTIRFLKHQGKIKTNTTVPRIIQHIKNDVGVFKYEAIKAEGRLSKSKNSRYSLSAMFQEGKTAYVELIPAVQICFFKKNSCSLRGYKIEYPEKYNEDWYA